LAISSDIAAQGLLVFRL